MNKATKTSLHYKNERGAKNTQTRQQQKSTNIVKEHYLNNLKKKVIAVLKLAPPAIAEGWRFQSVDVEGEKKH